MSETQEWRQMSGVGEYNQTCAGIRMSGMAYESRDCQCIYQSILKLFKRGVSEQYVLGSVMTRHDQSLICQLSLKDAPN